MCNCCVLQEVEGEGQDGCGIEDGYGDALYSAASEVVNKSNERLTYLLHMCHCVLAMLNGYMCVLFLCLSIIRCDVTMDSVLVKLHGYVGRKGFIST